jgi:cytochrome c biogenesis protein CcdA
MLNKIIISFIAGIIFGIVDVLNIYLIEDYLHPSIKKFVGVDKETLTIVSGVLAVIVSIITAIFVEYFLLTKYKYIIRYPVIDIIGIIIGTILFLFVLKLYYKLRKEYSNVKHQVKKEDRYID